MTRASPSTGSGQSFTAEVLAAGQGGHAVVVPKAIAGTFASKRPPVLAYIDGAEYRSRLMVYGGVSYLGLRKDLLRQIGRQAGDEVTVELVEAEPPKVEVEVPDPPELLEALAANTAAEAAYAALPPSHRREYARWVGEAAKPETRAERAERTVRRLGAHH